MSGWSHLECVIICDELCVVQVIRGKGDWDRSAMAQSYLSGFTPESLLAMGGWPGAAQKDFTKFWDPRFLVTVPQGLIYALCPFLEELEKQVAAMKIPPISLKSAVLFYPFLMTVVVQDALVLCRRFPDHPVHVLLNEYEEFR